MALISMRLVLVALLTALVGIASARPAVLFSRDPKTDPFYQPPEGFESKPPGTILRERSTIPSFFGLIPDPVEAHQLLYRTTAINGSAIATVTTVFKPWFPKKDRFVSFHTAYDSSSVTCSPSYQYQLGTVQTDIISSVEFFILEAYLLKGYVVASSDYEGPDAAFAAGRLEGMAVLDNMRAVNAFSHKIGLNTSNPAIVGTGYSGGAIATGWAASLQPTYAPELNIKGWVQGGTPANLTGTLVTLDDTVFSGFLPAAIDGLTKPSTYGAQLNALVNSVVTPYGRSAIDFANKNCAVADLLNFPEKSLLSTDVQKLGPALLEQPAVKSVLQQNIMGLHKNETPTAPVFVYHATQDEIIPYANTSTLVDAWCQNGADVKFTTFKAGGHATTEVVGVPDAVTFVDAAFEGSTQKGCHRNTELKSTLDPIALGVDLEPVLLKLVEALTDLGKQDENVMKNKTMLKTKIH